MATPAQLIACSAPYINIPLYWLKLYMFAFESVYFAFTSNEITKARRNYKLGHAMLHTVTVLPDGSGYVIDSECQGSGRRPYRQKIELVREANDWYVDGTCSCPMRYNCKHVACVLIAFEADQASTAAEKQIIGNNLENWLDAIHHTMLICKYAI